MDKGLSELTVEDKITLLESILSVMPLVPKPEEPKKAEAADAAKTEGAPPEAPPGETDDGKKEKKVNPRIIAVAALVDISRAFKTPPKEVYRQIIETFQGGPADSKNPKQALTPLSDEEKTLLLKLIIDKNFRKRDSTPATLIAYLKNWKEMSAMFSQETRIEGLADIWGVVKALFPDQVASTIKTLNQTLAGVAQEDRPRGVLIFDNLLKEKMRAKQAEYRSAMNNYEMELMKLNFEYEKRKLEKSALTKPSFYAVGGAIATIALIGLILALLGIERNTRTMEQLISAMNASNREKGS